MGRRVRILITAAVVLAVAAPVVLDRDSFPLSTYPMYARARSEVVSVVTARLVDEAGTASRLTLSIIGDSDDPLIVAGELRTAIGAGRALERCDEIARRAAGWSELPPGNASIEVVTERHDVAVRADRGDSLLARTVHAACEVPT